LQLQDIPGAAFQAAPFFSNLDLSLQIVTNITVNGSGTLLHWLVVPAIFLWR